MLVDEEDGPVVEIAGTLAKNGQDQNKLTQVDAPEWNEVEADAIDGKPGFEVTGESEEPADDSEDAGDESGAEDESGSRDDDSDDDSGDDEG